MLGNNADQVPVPKLPEDEDYFDIHGIDLEEQQRLLDQYNRNNELYELDNNDLHEGDQYNPEEEMGKLKKFI